MSTQKGPDAMSGRSVTSRALSVLDAFDERHPSLTLSEISRRAGLPVATAHRFLRELSRWGALEEVADQRYVIGRRIWELGLLSPARSSIIDVAAPHMQDVLYETQSVVNLFILDKTDAVLVTRISGTNVGVPLRQVGERLPLHASAAGKVLLCYGGDLLQRTLRSRPLSTFTDKTIRTHERLEQELRDVRRNGFAATAEELGPDNFGTAVPVFEHGTARMALGVVTKEQPTNIGVVVPVLRLAARAISRKLDSVGFSLEGVPVDASATDVPGRPDSASGTVVTPT